MSPRILVHDRRIARRLSRRYGFTFRTIRYGGRLGYLPYLPYSAMKVGTTYQIGPLDWITPVLYPFWRQRSAMAMRTGEDQR